MRVVNESCVVLHCMDDWVLGWLLGCMRSWCVELLSCINPPRTWFVCGFVHCVVIVLLLHGWAGR